MLPFPHHRFRYVNRERQRVKVGSLGRVVPPSTTGIVRALEQLSAVEEALVGYPMLHGVRADLPHRAGRAAEAAGSYWAAVEQAGTEAERRYPRRRLAEVDP